MPSLGYTKQDFIDVIKAVSEGRIKTDDMCTAKIKLDDLVDGGFKELLHVSTDAPSMSFSRCARLILTSFQMRRTKKRTSRSWCSTILDCIIESLSAKASVTYPSMYPYMRKSTDQY